MNCDECGVDTVLYTRYTKLCAVCRQKPVRAFIPFIKTPEDHQAALALVEWLIDADIPVRGPGDWVSRLLDPLAAMVEIYEKEHFPLEGDSG